MAHYAQQEFINRFVGTEHFNGKKVLEVGSQDINGNNNHLYDNCDVLRIDLGPGKNVDLVCNGADLDHADETYDAIVSTEAFEHDSRFDETLRNIVRMLKSGGIFVFTCAGRDRSEHGTRQTDEFSSPHTLDFYKNRDEREVNGIINCEKTFSQWEFRDTGQDLQFWGIKK
ncbi:MAG: class I SAM-dependent methyltransferase [Bacteroidetes bacterium]|nr:class I SAM-dependent methyltransferase [Bacteroidota bacterium]